MTILIFLLVLNFLVLIHELGHFIASRMVGVQVEEFGLGFPPRLIAWFKNSRGHWRVVKKGYDCSRHTVFSLNLIPLGGFVRPRGEDSVGELGDQTSFANKTPGQRIFIVIAGVVMNIVLATLIFIAGLTIGWPQSTDNLGSGARVSSQELIIMEILPNSPAELAELQVNDSIVEINGRPASSVEVLREINKQAEGQPVNYKIKRAEEYLEFSIVAEELASQPGQHSLGVALVESGIVAYAWPQAIWQGIKLTAASLKNITLGFWYLIKGIFQGHNMSGQVAGPVGIAVITKQVSQLGWLYLLQFIALLSLNLAFINILPIPALDGGRLLFILVEKITGQPIKAKAEAWVHSIGFLLLMALVIWITIKDVLTLLF